ncbi:MAG: acetyl-CoA carboxylase biotin carboxyl carrier protein subunit [Clostridia bacterium]|nr:acetyl-CoA carboxylase biotin carboxyl carrier protein subunit [Clostridia bacterium]
MRRFNVKVNGKDYIVDIEEIEAGAETAAPSVESAPAAKPAAAEKAPVSGTEIKSPLQATVVKVIVAPGAKVSAGDKLCVLEAMKMEYDIVTPCAGTVSFIKTARGATVNEGDLLAVIS